MKRILIVGMVLLCGCAVGQIPHAKKTPTPKPIVLSGWMRHAGTHYLDLVEHVMQNSDDSQLYAKFLSDEKTSIKIDASGDDLYFFEVALESVRSLEDSTLALSHSRNYSRSKELRLYDTLYRQCRNKAESIIRSGTMSPDQFDDCLPSAYAKLATEAHAEDDGDGLDVEVRSMLDYCDKGKFDQSVCDKFKTSDKYTSWFAKQPVDRTAR